MLVLVQKTEMRKTISKFLFFFIHWSKDMGGLDEFWMDNATARAQFFLAKKD